MKENQRYVEELQMQTDGLAAGKKGNPMSKTAGNGFGKQINLINIKSTASMITKIPSKTFYSKALLRSGGRNPGMGVGGALLSQSSSCSEVRSSQRNNSMKLT